MIMSFYVANRNIGLVKSLAEEFHSGVQCYDKEHHECPEFVRIFLNIMSGLIKKLTKSLQNMSTNLQEHFFALLQAPEFQTLWPLSGFLTNLKLL